MPQSRRPAGRGLLLLVLLAGVLGMHGLPPAPAPARAAGHAMTAPHHEVSVTGPGEDCLHTGGSSGHAEHADAACAASGISSAYVPPALTATPAVPGAADGTAATVPEGAVGGRAPPDLSELQLLRI
ncbi:hypothetical protein KYY02_22250 [Streptomyces pimonensis]|uniref:Secreted protein n=1 Tax=Streptomyces pimonensis TaxID=2860288 RepID=A0ABV4J310_9ACTN